MDQNPIDNFLNFFFSKIIINFKDILKSVKDPDDA